MQASKIIKGYVTKRQSIAACNSLYGQNKTKPGSTDLDPAFYIANSNRNRLSNRSENVCLFVVNVLHTRQRTHRWYKPNKFIRNDFNIPKTLADLNDVQILIVFHVILEYLLVTAVQVHREI